MHIPNDISVLTIALDMDLYSRPKTECSAECRIFGWAKCSSESGGSTPQEEFDFMADAGAYEEIERVNVNCTFKDNLQQASSSGTQSDKAPVYDSDGSAEVLGYEDWRGAVAISIKKVYGTPIVTIRCATCFGGVTDVWDQKPRIMPPKRFKKKSVRKIVEKRVAKAIEKYEKTRADSNNVVDRTEVRRLKSYIRGFPERNRRNITSSKPGLAEAITSPTKQSSNQVLGWADMIWGKQYRIWGRQP
ncbi:hypothetical protein Tco_0654216 [Tanacetum coccineum]|uniref:Uncharacterized protein n=1 Tax=Tanacetum coccineum TaxID=301880 RepID=A0ABQ4X2K9_9ASTR